MTNGISITPQDTGEYRITWQQPVKFDLKTLVLVCMHQVRVISPDESEDTVIGVEGERERLLAWLRSLQIVDEENMRHYEQAMTASLSSAPGQQESNIAPHPGGVVEPPRGDAQRPSGKHRRRHKRQS
jgi:hypothetical protein